MIDRRIVLAPPLALCLILVGGIASARPSQAQEVPPRATVPAAAPVEGFAAAIDRARALQPLETLLVSQGGDILVDEGFRGHSTAGSTNIKSASKSIVSALVGIAIEKGVLEGVDQKIAPLLEDKLPAEPDPRIADITIGHLLSMQAGLGRTSGPNYGAWISSRDWVRAALARPMDDDPGGPMLYSTGSTHLLSAILTRESGRSTLALAREWLGPSGIEISDWERDPQGIYLGGNQMAMSPRSLLAFGELYRNGGRNAAGEQVVPADWIAQSWVARTRSRFSGEPYGYGWFEANFAGQRVHYGWGYGGQMIYVLPGLDLTVAITSSEGAPSARSGYKEELHRLVAETIVPAALARNASAGDPKDAGRS